MKGWMGRARPLTWRPPASRPLPMTAHPRDAFPLHTVLCHICCWEVSPPSIQATIHLLLLSPKSISHYYMSMCMFNVWIRAFTTLPGAQRRCCLKDRSCWKFGPQVDTIDHIQLVVSSGAKPGIWHFCYLSIMSLTFPNPPCQHILMQHMDGGSIELLSVVLLFITFYPLFEMKSFPLIFPILVPLQLLSCN